MPNNQKKLRIICSLTHDLNRCKTNVEYVIISAAEKYISQLRLTMSVLSIYIFSAIRLPIDIQFKITILREYIFRHRSSEKSKLKLHNYRICGHNYVVANEYSYTNRFNILLDEDDEFNI